MLPHPQPTWLMLGWEELRWERRRLRWGWSKQSQVQWGSIIQTPTPIPPTLRPGIAWVPLAPSWEKEILRWSIPESAPNHDSVQSLSHVWLFVTPWTAAHQASLPSPSPRACSKPRPLSWWCHPTISSSVTPSSCLQSFPASGALLMSWHLASGGISSLHQRIGDSASIPVLLMSIQDWFPLWWTGLIFLQSKKLSRVSNTTVQKH